MRHGSKSPDSFEPSEPPALTLWERRRLDDIERALTDDSAREISEATIGELPMFPWAPIAHS